jgi:hypothetical protein
MLGLSVIAEASVGYSAIGSVATRSCRFSIWADHDLAASMPATLGFCLDAAEQRSNDSSPGKNIAVGLVFQQNQNCVKGLFQELQSKWIYRVAGGYIVLLC